eukprot:CAMPEP_0185029606 /NCGR_PEP_ID=MMETSP1103-20130426/16007_1 /TAXON_ID=36769 /ORGANISM="Paraphysomonas bandaiensis, Strain Caron Lab Isolate" /LENGTH=796 /DNA_ID=CAMNT_0027564415 /DNA_START=137 /DNA_END=2527 /DNA_ORIENTATION=+
MTDDQKRLVVLDDDPTGCQTMHSINVLLQYSVEDLCKQLSRDDKTFYILTNSRSMKEEDAVKVTLTAVSNLYKAAVKMGYEKEFEFISRGDSTLRGHFPAETEALMEATGTRDHAATVLIPSFVEGGRITLNGVHYVAEGDSLIPVGNTAYSADPHFGYSSSDLREWVVEKSKGRIDSSRVHLLPLEEIRIGGAYRVQEVLYKLKPGHVLVVDVVDQDDLAVFVTGLLQAEQVDSNKKYIFRTAASYVATRSGLTPKPLLTGDQLVTEYTRSESEEENSNGDGGKPPNTAGGLVVVGSYVPKTNSQLQVLMNDMNVFPVEFEVKEFRTIYTSGNEAAVDELVDAYAARVETLLRSGVTVVFYTSRSAQKPLRTEDTNPDQQRSCSPGQSAEDISFYKAVSTALTSVVNRLNTQPAFLVAKGGITSHDVAALGLGLSWARVLGQIETGVPVWMTPPESKFPGMKYVVFPGNVGDDGALARVVSQLGVVEKTHESSPSCPITPLRPNTTVRLLSEVRDQKKAVAAFNVYNLEGAKAVIDAAEELSAPVILQVHPASLKFGGLPFLRLLAGFRELASVPVAIHFDHATDESQIISALDMRAGNRNAFDSVLIDGSRLTYEENAVWTAKMTELAHSRGIAVEAELGQLAGEEDGLSVPEVQARMTDPALVAGFLSHTKVDMLAVTIGNVHGRYSRPPALDFPRLSRIRAVIECNAPDTLLVLHGASGLPPGQVIRSIQQGRVCKFNVNTDLRVAAMDYVRDSVMQDDDIDVLPLMRGTYECMMQVAKMKIQLFRSVSGTT